MTIFKNNLFKQIFLLAFFVTMVGAVLEMNYIDGNEIILISSIAFTLVYVLIGIYEVNFLSKLKRSEKNIWTISFLIIPFIAGLIYLLDNRERIT